jgi:hypothetical protein
MPPKEKQESVVCLRARVYLQGGKMKKNVDATPDN